MENKSTELKIKLKFLRYNVIIDKYTMSDSESEPDSQYSDTEYEEQPQTAPTLKPTFSGITAEDADEDEDEDEMDGKPKLKIGEEIDNISEDDEDDDLDVLSEQDSGSEPEDAMDLKEPNENFISQMESSSDEEEDEDYLKRFDADVIQNHTEIYHPEASVHNYDEVRALSKVTKDVDGIINDDKHKTLPFLTKFEKSKVLGIRAKQIDEGAQPFVKIMPNVITGYTIATMELIQKKIPFIIRRPLPNGSSEYWKVSDLEIIN